VIGKDSLKLNDAAQIQKVGASPWRISLSKKPGSFFATCSTVFSSEVDTGSREENAIR
jgi:hypothetical protein